MIGAILDGAARLDDWLAAKLGRPYRALLGFGLVLEIVREVRDLPDAIDADRGPIPHILSLLLFAALLLHQVAEMHGRFAARQGRNGGRDAS